jgi:hypothetical protein
MHKWRVFQLRTNVIRNQEDSTDTAYDFVRRNPRKQKRDIAFWAAFIGGIVAGASWYIVDLVRTVR